MKKILYINLILLLALSLFTTSCEKEELLEDSDSGNSTNTDSVFVNACIGDSIRINDVSFKVNYITKLNEFTEGNFEEIDFSKGGALINCSFSSEVSWKILISNQNQKKEYSGNGKEILIQWYGNVDSIVGNQFLFHSGEVSIELQVPCMPIISKEIFIKGTQDFSDTREDFGFLIRDWDKKGTYPIALNEYSTEDGWSGGSGLSSDFSISYESNSPSPMGGDYLKMYSKSEEPSWYLGTTFLELNDFYNHYNSLNEEPYFNVFFKGNEQFSSTTLEFSIRENNKNYFISYPVDWTGWRLVSFKLSELRSNLNESLTNYDNLEGIYLNLGANPIQAKELEVNYDFIFLSYGRPLSKYNVLENPLY